MFIITISFHKFWSQAQEELFNDKELKNHMNILQEDVKGESSQSRTVIEPRGIMLSSEKGNLPTDSTIM